MGRINTNTHRVQRELGRKEGRAAAQPTQEVLTALDAALTHYMRTYPEGTGSSHSDRYIAKGAIWLEQFMDDASVWPNGWHPIIEEARS